MITGRALGGAFHARVQGSSPGLRGLKETKIFFRHPHVKPDSFHFYMIITIGIVGLGGHS